MVTITKEMPEKLVYQKPETLADVNTHYCPGCTHGVAHRIVAEVIDELAIREKTILVASVGCSVFSYKYLELDACEAAHGRAAAMATGIKRVNPDNVVFTYQGDGDLASIGIAETIHAAARGENLTIIFMNNAIYGMTGGQMAPTTLIGQTTSSSPFGRDVDTTGYPLRIVELLAGLEGTTGKVCNLFNRSIAEAITMKVVNTVCFHTEQDITVRIILRICGDPCPAGNFCPVFTRDIEQLNVPAITPVPFRSNDLFPVRRHVYLTKDFTMIGAP